MMITKIQMSMNVQHETQDAVLSTCKLDRNWMRIISTIGASNSRLGRWEELPPVPALFASRAVISAGSF